MRQCPNCKSDNPDDARFCNYCGMRLPESKEETLYNDLEGLEKARKVEFSDQEIAEESEKVIDEAKKLFEPEWSEEPEENDGLKKQLTIPENLDHMIEEVTREELEQELHRKIKLREQDLKENETPEEEPVEEPTRMIGEDSKEEADEPTRMFTGDIGDFIKKKKDYEDVPEEDAYEEILQSWERKRKEKKIKREKEGKDPSRVPQFIRDKRSWSDMTTGQKKAVKRIAAGILIVAVFCIIEVYHGRPEAVAERYCKAYIQENWKKAGRLSDLPLRTNLTSAFYTCKCVVPHMLEQKSGCIINMSSSAGKTAHPNASICYGVSKAGINSLTQKLAYDLAPSGIRVNAVCPGPIETDMSQQWTPEYREKVYSAIPLRRLGTGEDVANVAVFLASEMSAFIVGESINVNGGKYMN